MRNMVIRHGINPLCYFISHWLALNAKAFDNVLQSDAHKLFLRKFKQLIKIWNRAFIEHPYKEMALLRGVRPFSARPCAGIAQ
ncbi:hypothetical protein D3C78_1050890 [compost metagenome]